MKEIHYVKASNVPTGTAVVEQIKLHTVNVIEMTDGNFQSVRSFADNPSGNTQAERLFKRLVKEYEAQSLTEDASFKLSDKDDMETYLDDGIYQSGPSYSGYQILLTHSV